MPGEDIFLAGRYNKYLRNLSQSPWIDKSDKRIKQSVQELIEDGLKKFLKFKKCVFSSSGREDVDVRMLGKGRPFVFRLVNLEESNPEPRVVSQIQDYINSSHRGMIHIRDLQVVSKEAFAKNIKDGEEEKTKSYSAICCCSRLLSDDDILRISSMKDLVIKQKTPIRVLHRRSLIVRDRMIHKLNLRRLDAQERGHFPNDHGKVFRLELLTEAGTYIKEFVHGDFGRTKPDLSELIQSCECDLIELDVMEVNLDWPPSVDVIMATSAKDTIETGSDRTTMDDEDLNVLYSKALKALKEAESMPRGLSRQDAYDTSRKLFQHASELVDSSGLFSRNETVEDIATSNLKFLLIPAHLSKIAVSTECSADRIRAFTRAECLIKEYIENLSSYGLVDDCTLSLTKDSDSESQRVTTSSGELKDMMLARTEKISRYKKMKLLEDHVRDLEAKVEHEQADDETLRDYYLSLIKKTLNDTIDCLENQVRPALVLEKMRAQGDPVQPATGSQPKPLKPFTLVKSQLQGKVFGLGYPSAPSVSVDQFIDQKFAAGELSFQTQKDVYTNSLQRYAEQPNLRREQEEESDEEREAREERDDDVELQRKRNWDEFKDDNARGSGNRYNMG